MRRDMDLVRLILLRVEDSESSYIHLSDLECDEYPLSVVGYHAELMVAHGLLDATVQKAWGGEVVAGTIKALTWDGHDYLDAIRDDRVWRRTKRTIAESVGSTTLAVIKDVASMVAVQMVKAQMGIAP